MMFEEDGVSLSEGDFGDGDDVSFDLAGAVAEADF
jgi:hypothetical protein